MVYEHLYTSFDNCLPAGDKACYLETRPHWLRERPDFSGHPYLLPRDRALYLSAFHVGSTIAAEAAEIMYSKNVFVISYHGPGLRSFFETDHFASGILPKHVIRHIALYPESTGTYNRYNEACCDFRFEVDYADECEARWHLELLRALPALRRVEFHLLTGFGLRDDDDDRELDLRGLAPVVFELRKCGRRVVVRRYADRCVDVDRRSYRHLCGPSRDISKFFDRPTNRDRKIVAAYKRSSACRNGFLGHRNHRRVWQLNSSPRSWLRVKLRQHYVIYKRLRAGWGPPDPVPDEEDEIEASNVARHAQYFQRLDFMREAARLDNSVDKPLRPYRFWELS